MVSLPDTKWSYNFTLPPSVTSGIGAVEEVLDQAISDTSYPSFERNEDTITFTHDWLFSPCWYAYDVARYNESVTRTKLQTNNQNTWNGKPPVTSVFTSVEPDMTRRTVVTEQPTIDNILDTLERYYVFNLDAVTGETIQSKCGDISRLLGEAVWQEYNIEPPVINGGIVDPERNVGWPHSFLKFNVSTVSGVNHPVIIDGTAKQFADCYDWWPQTLGPEEEIAVLEVVTPHDDKWEYYTEESDSFETPDYQVSSSTTALASR